MQELKVLLNSWCAARNNYLIAFVLHKCNYVKKNFSYKLMETKNKYTYSSLNFIYIKLHF